MLHDKVKTYLHFHKEQWASNIGGGDLGWGIPTYQFTMPP